MIARPYFRIGLGVLQLALAASIAVGYWRFGMSRGVLALAAVTAAVVCVSLFVFRREE